jgi:hypothetical protein
MPSLFAVGPGANERQAAIDVKLRRDKAPRALVESPLVVAIADRYLAGAELKLGTARPIEHFNPTWS